MNNALLKNKKLAVHIIAITIIWGSIFAVYYSLAFIIKYSFNYYETLKPSLAQENPPYHIEGADNELFTYHIFEQKGDFTTWFPKLYGVDSTSHKEGVFYKGKLIYKYEYGCFHIKVFNIFTTEQFEQYQETDFNGKKPFIRPANKDSFTYPVKD